MMTFSTRVQEQRKSWWSHGGDNATFKIMVQDALRAAAKLWLTEMLPLHFGVAAFGRYGYAPRTSKYQDVKRSRKFVRGTSPSLKGLWVPNPNYGQTPAPLRYTGELEAYVMAKSPEEYLGAASVTATANKQVVRVKIPLPHPLNPKNAGEITKVRSDELERLTQKANGELRRLMATAGTTRSTETVAA